MPMASDMAVTLVSGLAMQACEDADLPNFGVFDSAELRLVFDVNASMRRCPDRAGQASSGWRPTRKSLAGPRDSAARTGYGRTRHVRSRSPLTGELSGHVLPRPDPDVRQP